jgi:pyruvate/2-oxoglutarate dehydrogenase complex dihydrolipoamide dehydrogenase (E3) component
VALVDKSGSLGGDCLHTGCVPTKRLVHSAKVASILRHSADFGIDAGPVNVNFPMVMEHMREVQDEIAVNDDPERFRKMGVNVVFGGGHFIDPHTFEVNGDRLAGRKFLIATGSSPRLPPVAGLEEAGVLTNETVLRLARLPESMVILGGGPIAVEFAQIFARLGTRVTLVEKKGKMLPREDMELSSALKDILVAEGITVDTCSDLEVKGVKGLNGDKELRVGCADGERTYTATEVMVAIGRRPNVGGLGLDAAGVEYDEQKGVKVDSHLRTTQKNIYACGDLVGHFHFTHVAEYQSGIAMSNALFPFKRKVDYRVVPWVTFTDPELARVGMTEDEAREEYGKDNVKVYRHYFKDTDRAVIEGEGRGLIKLVCDKKGRLLGAHILGPGGGELIHEYVLAMQANVPITKISRSIHVYPTVAQAVKRASDQYYKEKLFTGWFPKFARFLIRLGR